MSSSLIVPRDVAVRMLDQACATCRYSWKDPAGDLNCRRNPPTAFLIPMPSKLGTSMELRPFSTFPVVRPDYWCGGWTERGTTTG
jgi:hypothetical protein